MVKLGKTEQEILSGVSPAMIVRLNYLEAQRNAKQEEAQANANKPSSSQPSTGRGPVRYTVPATTQDLEAAHTGS